MQIYSAWLYWNPPKNVFTIPFIDHPIAWYGVLFVLGFILSYFILISIFARFLNQTKELNTLDITNWPLLIQQLLSSKSPNLDHQVLKKIDPSIRLKLQNLNQTESPDRKTQEAILQSFNAVWNENNLQREDFEKTFPETIASARQTSYFLADRLCWFVVLGALIGAKLGVVFFYDWNYFSLHPIEILKVWKGGLASHGGVLGVIFSLIFYSFYIKKYIPKLYFLRICDFVSVPSGLAAFFIRLGNFMNQEILGLPTSKPWGIIFGHPVDGSFPTARHPVQLYEGMSYFFIFLFLYWLWNKKSAKLSPGMLTGIVLILVFTSRFFLEFWKENQESFIHTSTIQMGQLLSLPFIAFGFFIIWYGKTKFNFKDYCIS